MGNDTRVVFRPTGRWAADPVPLFFRAHQSHVVNTKFVRKLTKAEGDCLLMADKSIIPLARRRKEAFMELMKGG